MNAPGSPDDAPYPDDPESVYQVYLTTDVRPAILAAPAGPVRGVLRMISRHLCGSLSPGGAGLAALEPGRRQPWEVCEAGAGMAAGFQLYHHVTQAIAGTYLHAIGFDPARATADPAYYATGIAPLLAAGRTQRLRSVLLALTDRIDQVLADSDATATANAAAQTAITDDLWETATGVSAAIQLYQHAVRVLSVHVLFYIWDGLGIGNPQLSFPYIPGTNDGAFFTIHPN